MHKFVVENLSSDTEISDIVLKNPYLTLFLEHFNIEFPFQQLRVVDVCTEKNINPELFLTIAGLYCGAPVSKDVRFRVTDIISIVDYLKNGHHYYTHEIYPKIRHIIEQMSTADNRKEMVMVEKFFDDYFDEVTEHLNYENNLVFPYILGKYMRDVKSENTGFEANYSVIEYKKHHNDIEEKLSDLKNLLIKYLPPANDQPLRRELLLTLYELEYDLGIHSRIEDFILIPLVTEMESRE
jgi:regulator of cell morphogenesis and NO signaling